MKIRTLYSLFFILLCFGCAKKRPVEKLLNPEGLIFQKGIFLGKRSISDQHALNPINRSFWFSRVTVTHASNKYHGQSIAFAGLQSNLKIGFFDFKDDELLFQDGISLESLPESIYETINSWPIEHFDISLETSDGKTLNKEINNPLMHKEDKRLFKINWSESIINETQYFPVMWAFNEKIHCWKKLSSRLDLDSVEVSPDYIGFTIIVDYGQNASCSKSIGQFLSRKFNQQVHYYYSFKRIKDEDFNSYTPYVFSTKTHESISDPILKTYCHFNTTLPFLNEENHRIENKILMDRWDPKKTHVFYFDKEFPNEYKFIFNDEKTGVFPRINQLFEQYGLPTRFLIKENTGQRFGDLRYSIVKANLSVTGNLIGFGPSSSNPLTGEIISANTVIWPKKMIGLLKSIREQLEFPSINKVQDEWLFSNMVENLSGQENLGFRKLKELVETFSYRKDEKSEPLSNLLLSELVFKPPGGSYQNVGSSFFNGDSYPEGLNNYLGGVSDSRLRSISEKTFLIQQELDERLKRIKMRSFDKGSSVLYFSDGLQSKLGMSVLLNAERFNEFNETSNEVLLKRGLYNLSVHEVLHNLNLCHNFMGSFDKHNFKENSETSFTSSVMEYLDLFSLFYHSDMDLGAYDKAALVYAYSNGEIDISKEKERNYLSCDDYETFNVLCNRQDSGTTFSEVMLNHVFNYNHGYYLRNLPREAFWDVSTYPSKVIRTMTEVKNFLISYETGFNQDYMKKKLDELTREPLDHLKQTIIGNINSDLFGANLIGASFLNSVINIPKEYRHFEDQYNGESMLTSKGINFDKEIASLIFLGHHNWFYSPHHNPKTTSYLTVKEDSLGSPRDDLMKQMMEKSISNLYHVDVTNKYDFIEEYFLHYWQNALNQYNYNEDKSLLKKMGGFYCFLGALDKVTETIRSDFDDVDGVLSPLISSNQAQMFSDKEKMILKNFANTYYLIFKKDQPYIYSLVSNIFSKYLPNLNKDLQVSSLDKLFHRLQRFYFTYNLLINNLSSICMRVAL